MSGGGAGQALTVQPCKGRRRDLRHAHRGQSDLGLSADDDAAPAGPTPCRLRSRPWHLGSSRRNSALTVADFGASGRRSLLLPTPEVEVHVGSVVVLHLAREDLHEKPILKPQLDDVEEAPARATYRAPALARADGQDLLRRAFGGNGQMEACLLYTSDAADE